MDMMAIDDLVPDILPYVTGCTVNTIRSQILYTAIDFCRRTMFSQEMVVGLDIIAEEFIVPVPSPSIHVELLYAFSVGIRDRGFIPEINPRVAAMWGTDPMRQFADAADPAEDFPSAWSNVPSVGIKLYPVPATTTESCLSVRGAYRPTRNATKIDRRLIDEHHQAIVRGTLYRLQMMVAEDWGNPNAAMIHDKDYELEVSNARVEVNRDFGLAQVFIQPFPLA
jgi:hypothetical protein